MGVPPGSALAGSRRVARIHAPPGFTKTRTMVVLYSHPHAARNATRTPTRPGRHVHISDAAPAARDFGPDAHVARHGADGADREESSFPFFHCGGRATKVLSERDLVREKPWADRQSAPDIMQMMRMLIGVYSYVRVGLELVRRRHRRDRRHRLLLYSSRRC
ncbi:hypothetical protein BT67DRAFT_250579 [Trichocladium antarcticum]|uniref:Uncharacterized protein n=1 Tax=Trichocladium antarcticum TaxID=1450529 RepID=A0AAN6Z9V1_9PEZI|nr:hypothetical protein BT67DRAFT_250579 [Trichocladium antarcticum]